MMRHVVAGVLLSVTIGLYGAMLLGGVSACGGCPGHCTGTMFAARVEPPIDCVEVYPDAINGDCGCDAYVQVRNNCEVEISVEVGDISISRCTEGHELHCLSISPGQISKVWRWASDAREARIPLWKDGVKHEIVAEVQIEFN